MTAVRHHSGRNHFKPNPVYTEEAAQLKLEGEVLLEVMFGANGQLHVNRVVRGLGHGLDEAAIAAANKMRFKPALRNGQPDGFDGNRSCGVPVGVLRTKFEKREDLSHAYLEMDVHCFPAGRVERHGSSKRRHGRSPARNVHATAAAVAARHRTPATGGHGRRPPPWIRSSTAPSSASTR